MRKERTHSEPLILACHSPMEGEVFGSALEYVLVCKFDCTVRGRSTGNDKLHSYTSQLELRINLFSYFTIFAKKPTGFGSRTTGMEPKILSTPANQLLASVKP
ncbi:hypothetical protein AVEN_94301-1 [Araneus ventricosus]|uniref:Uncharacterized protein n=1 Tax=Araneus ventricosus TaxID=182803 RepID=A0A4Y2I8Y8_ARAVE|nr:hypothetical protein AVEN_94301-1 [Araneus ventricosus]